MAEDDSQVSYLEGCTAPSYDSNQAPVPPSGTLYIKQLTSLVLRGSPTVSELAGRGSVQLQVSLSQPAEAQCQAGLARGARQASQATRTSSVICLQLVIPFIIT